MKLSELKNLHPGLYAEAIADGVACERERCVALLPKISRYMSREAVYMTNCIQNGKPCGDKEKVHYMVLQLAAHRKKQDSAKVVSLVEYNCGVSNEPGQH